MSKSNVLRSDTSATHYAECADRAGAANPARYGHLRYLTVREIKALPAEQCPFEHFWYSPSDCRTYVNRGHVETAPRSGARKFYVRTERSTTVQLSSLDR